MAGHLAKLLDHTGEHSLAVNRGLRLVKSHAPALATGQDHACYIRHSYYIGVDSIHSFSFSYAFLGLPKSSGSKTMAAAIFHFFMTLSRCFVLTVKIRGIPDSTNRVKPSLQSFPCSSYPPISSITAMSGDCSSASSIHSSPFSTPSGKILK